MFMRLFRPKYFSKKQYEFHKLEEFNDDAQEVPSRDWEVRATLMRTKRQHWAINLSHKHDDIMGVKLTEDKDRKLDVPYSCTEGRSFDECETCHDMYFPAAVEITAEEALKWTENIMTDIHKDKQYLADTLKDHADFIVNKWRKMTRTKRTEFLRDTTTLVDSHASLFLQQCLANKFMDGNPFNESLDKHLLFDYLNKLRALQVDQQHLDDWHDSWFLPYLDIETLAADPLALLALLHYRGTRELAAWAKFDAWHAYLAEHVCAIPPTYNDKAVIMNNDHYGELTEWEQSRAHHWDVMGFTRAQFVLTAQHRLLAMLRRVLERLILGSKHEPCEDNPKWFTLGIVEFTRFDDRFTEPMIERSVYRRLPFAPPFVFDVHGTWKRINAMANAAIDHVWMIQTEPAYLQAIAARFLPLSFSKNFDRNETWLQVCYNLLLNPLRSALYWRQMVVDCKMLLDAYEVMMAKSHEHESLEYGKLHREWSYALWVLQRQLQEFFTFQLSYLRDSVALEPDFEDHFQLFPNSQKNPKVVDMHVRHKDYQTKDVLFWCLYYIGQDQYRSFNVDPVVNFATMEKLLKKQPDEQTCNIDVMSQRLYDDFSECAFLDELNMTIEWEGTRDRQVPASVFRQSWKERAGFHVRTAALYRCDHRTVDLKAHHIKEIEEFFTQKPWPAPGSSLDDTWIEQTIASRNALSSVWTHLRFILKQSMEKETCTDAEIQQEMAFMSYDKSHDLAITVQHERLSMFGIIDSKKYGRKPPPPIAFPPATPPPKGKKLKVMYVKKENLNLFQAMFTLSESKRPYSWQHFVLAMKEAGCEATQGYGNIVFFENRGRSDERINTIAVHTPHPKLELDPVQLRCLGKRLRKLWGWGPERFVERVEKGVEDGLGPEWKEPEEGKRKSKGKGKGKKVDEMMGDLRVD